MINDKSIVKIKTLAPPHFQSCSTWFLRQQRAWWPGSDVLRLKIETLQKNCKGVKCRILQFWYWSCLLLVQYWPLQTELCMLNNFGKEKNNLASTTMSSGQNPVFIWNVKNCQKCYFPSESFRCLIKPMIEPPQKWVSPTAPTDRRDTWKQKIK